MLVARMLCLFSSPPFYLLLFLFKRNQGLGCDEVVVPEAFSGVRACLPSRPSQASPCAAGPLPGDAGAQVHVRQPLLLPRLRALLPGPDRWAAWSSLPGTRVCTRAQRSSVSPLTLVSPPLAPEYMLCLQNGRFDNADRMFNRLDIRAPLSTF